MDAITTHSYKFRRVWTMPNKWTFLIPPVVDLLDRYCNDGKGWIDPFAGNNSRADITNDLNPNRPTTFHLDALDFLRLQPSNYYNGVLYDPPYSFRQAKECYNHYGKDLFIQHDYIPTMMDYWASCKIEISRITKTDGIVISCGWNSNGIGHNKGFELVELMLLAHGGSKNDTIITVERKTAYTLDFTTIDTNLTEETE